MWKQLRLRTWLIWISGSEVYNVRRCTYWHKFLWTVSFQVSSDVTRMFFFLRFSCHFANVKRYCVNVSELEALCDYALYKSTFTLHLQCKILQTWFTLFAEQGVLNAVAPQTATNAEFASAFARAMWRPAVFPVPSAALKLVYGSERAAVITEGQKVIPKRTLESGYQFTYPDLASACRQFSKLFILSDWPVELNAVGLKYYGGPLCMDIVNCYQWIVLYLFFCFNKIYLVVYIRICSDEPSIFESSQQQNELMSLDPFYLYDLFWWLHVTGWSNSLLALFVGFLLHRHLHCVEYVYHALSLFIWRVYTILWYLIHLCKAVCVCVCV